MLDLSPSLDLAPPFPKGLVGQRDTQLSCARPAWQFAAKPLELAVNTQITWTNSQAQSVRSLNKPGNYHCGHRVYDPGYGRWTTPDPVMASANLQDYVQSSPIQYTDQSGLDFAVTGFTPSGNQALDADCDGYEFQTLIEPNISKGEYGNKNSPNRITFQFVTVVRKWICCDEVEHLETRKFLEASLGNWSIGSKTIKDQQFLHDVKGKSVDKCGSGNTWRFMEMRFLTLGTGEVAGARALQALRQAGKAGVLAIDLSGSLRASQNPIAFDWAMPTWNGAKDNQDLFLSKGSFRLYYQAVISFMAQWNCKSHQCTGSQLLVRYDYFGTDPYPKQMIYGAKSP